MDGATKVRGRMIALVFTKNLARGVKTVGDLRQAIARLSDETRLVGAENFGADGYELAVWKEKDTTHEYLEIFAE
jgi:hypothetical protein